MVSVVSLSRWYFFILAALLLMPFSPACAQHQIPDPLKSWQDWATWNLKDRNNPPLFNDPATRPGFWPSQMILAIDAKSGRFTLTVQVFENTWITLPGDHEMWPQQVTANGVAVPVVEREEKPAVKLKPGTWKLAGSYQWDEMPQRVLLPAETGILSLTVAGKPMPSPTWNEDGTLWLKQERTGEAEKDFLGVQVYRVLEDGIPMWLRTEVEVTVSGKSREEDLGNILPEGWKLAQVNSPLPVAVDESGRMKAQVRAGRWKIRLDAFRLNSPETFSYAAGVKPAVEEELIAFRAKPDFRLVEILGIPAVDVAQTTMPDEWRELPVYRWTTTTPFRLEERMRGMGLQKAEGLKISREIWLDQNGCELTFRDRVTGNMQEIWRLDAAKGQELGSVRVGGEGQLITLNPVTKAPGVELRTRNLDIQATGRAKASGFLPATGWQADAESVNVSLNLPPGWRLFAVFGSDWVRGDWLTAWSLLDLFLLLVFSLAVFRLWGWGAGVLALFAFGLGIHEPGAPLYSWFFLLVPLALLRVVPSGWMTRVVKIWKWLAVGLLVLLLIPFAAKTIQAAMYPQLERTNMFGLFETKGGYQQNVSASAYNSDNEGASPPPPGAPEPAEASLEQSNAAPEAVDITRGRSVAFNGGVLSKTSSWAGGKNAQSQDQKVNMSYDTKARIQTGPGIPEWSWRTVSYGWNGPVTAEQTVHPILISMNMERFLAILRLGLVVGLASMLLGLKIPAWLRVKRPPAALALVLIFLAFGSLAQAQIPSEDMLKQLRERLIETSDAFPNAAEIPHASIQIRDRKILVETEIHTEVAAAVPLPGRLPAWSPLSVTVDGGAAAALRREDGFLWVALPAGVHRVRMEGQIPEGADWEWAFLLKPKLVDIDAPGWTHTGVRPNGVPEGQIFFNRQQKATSGEASYDRRDYQAVVSVDRYLEMGLIWKVRTVVHRLSSEGKAISLKVPLLPGENVLTSTLIVNGGKAEVRLGSQDQEIVWESELPVAEKLSLATQADDSWVERWHLTMSPVWNVALSGLAPVFEAGEINLVPVWHPWPGEKAELAFSRPEAVVGATLTIRRAQIETSLGSRQRISTLAFDVECSLGQDMPVELPEDAQVSSIKYNNGEIPVRKDGTKLLIPLRPGAQSVRVEWKENRTLGFWTKETAIRLPVDAANVITILKMPDDRWVLFAKGPLQGPAVRFWGVLAFALLSAAILGRLPGSPLKWWSWMLLAVGLTQINVIAALIVAGWFFILVWRGRGIPSNWPGAGYNLAQVALGVWTVVMLGILVTVVSIGLLGDPDMFIKGNGSSATYLKWYEARSGGLLPQPVCVSVSIWFYRLLMLAWALWLAFSLLKWLKWAWEQFSKGGIFATEAKVVPLPPPIPPQG